jgi:hypothetical protein
MASDNAAAASADKAPPAEIPSEAIEFATRMYNAAREGQIDVFEQVLPAGLPPNLTNDKGDTLVRTSHVFFA